MAYGDVDNGWTKEIIMYATCTKIGKKVSIHYKHLNVT